MLPSMFCCSWLFWHQDVDQWCNLVTLVLKCPTWGVGKISKRVHVHFYSAKWWCQWPFHQGCFFGIKKYISGASGWWIAIEKKQNINKIVITHWHLHNHIFWFHENSSAIWVIEATWWLVCSTPERVVWVQALARDIVLCCWTRHFTQCLFPPRCINGYRWT